MPESVAIRLIVADSGALPASKSVTFWKAIGNGTDGPSGTFYIIAS
jgi:hypothetical protein